MKVLIAIDDSSCSLQAIESVLARPWNEGTAFKILTVVPPFLPEYAKWQMAHNPLLAEVEDSMFKQGRKLVDDQCLRLKQFLPGFEVEGAVAEGEAAYSIVKAAEEWDCDLIVMGSHGRTGFSRFLLGSVAEAVLGRAPCSVEIIKSAHCHPDGPEQLARAAV